jgi:hypothetical protein
VNIKELREGCKIETQNRLGAMENMDDNVDFNRFGGLQFWNTWMVEINKDWEIITENRNIFSNGNIN